MHIKHHAAVGAWLHFPFHLKIKIFKFVVRHQVGKIDVNALAIFIQKYSSVLNLPGLAWFLFQIRMPALQILSIKKYLPAFLFLLCRDGMLRNNVETKEANNNNNRWRYNFFIHTAIICSIQLG